MEIYGIISLRVVVVYLLIVLIFRLMGKREIGELGIIDLVVFIMIADIAVIAIERYNESFFKPMLPMGILVLIQIIFSHLSLRSRNFRKLVDGEPIIIIKDGKIIEKQMKKQRYNFDDLLMQLRENNIRYISDVEFAILEPTGKLSVIKKEKNKTGYTVGLIIDGELQEEKLSELNLNKEWLYDELNKRGIKNLKEISFCSYENGKLYIDKNN
ncbi:hypothetical protein B4064_0272 [Caldibacillus thermoamylovorans]|uniref:DUF421 domain-containing protein n=1 Tax=Caldibacillus thermoamylovorans TaxID=35841 RepID=UPI0005A41E99|nr:DUF421 domain-containing protein [Caldibacillus thermoamylovorans]KIO62798.1 hypothetical protein B4064_0272 [Caldibacillus thermoamylovorans]KIO65829.1 hypothetical protein B4065_2442 [Caldibacillus thermoamylovorans]